MEPVIIECALNEQVTVEQNPSVPITPEELVADGLAAAEAGAAILHFHARDPATGDLVHPGTEFYRSVMRGIRAQNDDVILYPTYGASPTAEERFSHLAALADDPSIRLDFATIDPGAVNYAGFDPEAAAFGFEFIQSVSHAESRYFFELCKARGIQFSFTVRELGHVRHVLAYLRMGWVSGPLLLKVTMSQNHVWGIAPSPEGLKILTEAIIPAEVPYRWMTFVEGDRHAELSRYAVEHGGHVRTGVGDNPLFEGEALTNAEQVSRVVEMARAAGRGVAAPREARELLRRPVRPR